MSDVIICEEVFVSRTRQRKVVEPFYTVDSKTGCWNWRYSVTNHGYGQIWIPEEHKCIGAHRKFFMDHHKLSKLPDDLVVHHRCENRRCVNPEHLELIPFVTNLRISSKAKLSIEKARAIREGFTAGKSRKELAQEFGVHSVTVGAVINNKLWAEN